MDRLIAANSVPQAQADTAPTTGTPQFATDGNPASNIPATRWPAYAFNAMQEELIAILTAAGITPDRTNNAQVAIAIQKLISQSAATIGSSRNLAMSIAAASSTANLTADEIVVGSSLGGAKFVLGSFSKSINLAITGVGGMDAGSAPASGYVAIYAIYNPTTGANALIATNATNAVAPNVYGGGSMPAGYVASALVAVVPTNASGQFAICTVHGRKVYIPNTQAAISTSQIASPTLLSISAIVPKNAISIDVTLYINVTGSGITNPTTNLWSASPASAGPATQVTGGSGGGIIASTTSDFPLLTPQTVWWSTNTAGGTFNQGYFNIWAYEF
ncbi:hypothetical protein [Burkholderia anthina]|uniref:hypothetical protein n=1 Tax=Burkholderia anthina TaxID=179879 RepID=UPI001FC8C38C|nr:hypothetical protein [Burkholderia anthina]